MKLLQLLEKRFGSKVHHFTAVKDNFLYLYPEKLEQYNQPHCDKCTLCEAHIYRQDLPFWAGPHAHKKLMVVAQDAGKGYEENSVNTVFSIHVAILNTEKYFEASPRHKRYFELFKGMFYDTDFLNHIYFTDIIKCAYSTENKFKVSDINCADDLFVEMEAVNPGALLLMGTAAQSVFINLMGLHGHKLHFIHQFNCAINNRSSIKFQHYDYNGRAVFFVPHLIGNLHISKAKKDSFNEFVVSIQHYIKNLLHD